MVISGAAGAIGSVAAQIGKNRGARVIGIAGSAEKVRWLISVIGKLRSRQNSVPHASANPVRRIQPRCPLVPLCVWLTDRVCAVCAWSDLLWCVKSRSVGPLRVLSDPTHRMPSCSPCLAWISWFSGSCLNFCACCPDLPLLGCGDRLDSKIYLG